MRLRETCQRAEFDVGGAQEKDSAVVLIRTGDLKFPEEPIQLLPTDQRLSLGMEVGWLGYPAMASATLCFFAEFICANGVESEL